MTRLVAVGVLILGVTNVEQFLPQGCVLRSQWAHGLRNMPQALGNLFGALGQLV